MISQKELQRAAEFIRKNCTADDFTFGINGEEDLLTRFAQNGITQHITGNKLNVRLKVSFDNKTGSAAVNILDEDALKYLIETAQNMALLNQSDPEFVPSEAAHILPEINNYSEATAQLNVKTIVDQILQCVDNAKKKNAVVSGISEKEISSRYLITKNGFEGFDSYTSFAHSMTMKREGVETKVSRSVKDISTFSMSEMIDQLNKQFASLKNPEPMEKGKLPVILRPAALLDWLYMLLWTYGRRDADEGHTPYTDQIGEQFFGKRFTLISKIDDNDLTAPRFSQDGIPARNIEWIVNGVLKNMKTSRYYARKVGLEAMNPYNIIVDGGSATENEMMQKVKRGVIVNRLWYIRSVDRKIGEWTGLTRDGVLYFENGEIKRSVTNFRWNDIIHDATKRIIAIGPSVQQEYYAKVPTVLIDDFNFVDVTTF